MNQPNLNDLIYDDLGKIVMKANNKLKKIYEEYGWGEPKRLSRGDVTAVLEARQEVKKELLEEE